MMIGWFEFGSNNSSVSCVRSRLGESAAFFWRWVPDVRETRQMTGSSSVLSLFRHECEQQLLLPVEQSWAHEAEEHLW